MSEAIDQLQTEAERLLRIWMAFEEFDSAAQALLTSQPHQMTASAQRLDRTRKEMRRELQAVSWEETKATRKERSDG